jgi:hypothetical protein
MTPEDIGLVLVEVCDACNGTGERPGEAHEAEFEFDAHCEGLGVRLVSKAGTETHVLLMALAAWSDSREPSRLKVSPTAFDDAIAGVQGLLQES